MLRCGQVALPGGSVDEGRVDDHVQLEARLPRPLEPALRRLQAARLRGGADQAREEADAGLDAVPPCMLEPALRGRQVAEPCSSRKQYVEGAGVVAHTKPLALLEDVLGQSKVTPPCFRVHERCDGQNIGHCGRCEGLFIPAPGSCHVPTLRSCCNQGVVAGDVEFHSGLSHLAEPVLRGRQVTPPGRQEAEGDEGVVVWLSAQAQRLLAVALRRRQTPRARRRAQQRQAAGAIQGHARADGLLLPALCCREVALPGGRVDEVPVEAEVRLEAHPVQLPEPPRQLLVPVALRRADELVGRGFDKVPAGFPDLVRPVLRGWQVPLVRRHAGKRAEEGHAHLRAQPRRLLVEALGRLEAA
mmetsp:Transcript_63260/g.184881  ORF Transcript_63260/g.184881 Transcript_63260/m.184881 type:complete len:358 (-) Transcript_63260:241-1314(-)